MHTAVTEFRYLTRADVVRTLGGIDAVAVVSEALRLHSEGRVVLPEEAYLPWRSPAGAANRCLAMPAAVEFGDGLAVGLKTINASLGNIANGIPRSQGFTLLLDPETARPRVLMEAAYISALRTAAVTAVAAIRIGRPGLTSVSLIGCGTLARMHLDLLAEVLPSLAEVRLFDTDPARAAQFRDEARARRPELTIDVAASAQQCVFGADLVVPVTTVTEGYIRYSWLAPGTLVSNVSLDDLLPDVVRRCDLLVIDDWGLVSGDSRRLLGRMYRAGELLAPGDAVQHSDTTASISARGVDATLGEIVAGDHPGRAKSTDVVVCNAFGMAILDIAVAHRVASAAIRDGIGQILSL